MDNINVSRKETHKRSRYNDDLLFILQEIVWNRFLWGILVSVFINLAAYSYITNNYKTYMATEEGIRKVLTNTISIVHDIDSVEKVKFKHEIREVDYDENNRIGYVKMVFEPLDPAVDANDFIVSAGGGPKMELDNVKIYGDGTWGVYIHNRNTNEIVNNMLSVGYTLRDEIEIKEILKTESTSKMAKWFLDNFK